MGEKIIGIKEILGIRIPVREVCQPFHNCNYNLHDKLPQSTHAVVQAQAWYLLVKNIRFGVTCITIDDANV